MLLATRDSRESAVGMDAAVSRCGGGAMDEESTTREMQSEWAADTSPTERWGPADAKGVNRTLPPPPGATPEQTRYDLGPLLGSGGMGDVHACEDRRIGR